MADTNQTAKVYFTKVKVARDLLRAKAEEILNQYLDNIKKMQDLGDYAGAAKSLQWLIEHMPSEDDGTRAVDGSVDKSVQQVAEKPTGPAIQIGIQVGGITPRAIQGTVTKPSALPPAEIIDADS